VIDRGFVECFAAAGALDQIAEMAGREQAVRQPVRSGLRLRQLDRQPLVGGLGMAADLPVERIVDEIARREAEAAPVAILVGRRLLVGDALFLAGLDRHDEAEARGEAVARRTGESIYHSSDNGVDSGPVC